MVAVVAPAFAQDTTATKRTLEGDAKKAAAYGGGVVTGSVNTVGEAAYGTTKAAVSPFQSLWNWMTGKDKGEKVVTNPVNETGKTIHDAAVNTGDTLAGKKK